MRDRRHVTDYLADEKVRKNQDRREMLVILAAALLGLFVILAFTAVFYAQTISFFRKLFTGV